MTPSGFFRRSASVWMLAVAVGALVGSALAHIGAGGAAGLLAHFAPFYLIAVAPLTLAIFSRSVPWRWTIVAASAGALLASGLLVFGEFTRDVGPIASSKSPDQIKVIQFNALSSNADVREIADWLISQRPDIVTVCEASPDLRDELVKRAGWRVAGGHGSLMIFTAQSYLKMDRPISPQAETPQFVNATYASASGPLEVVTTHLNRRSHPSVGPQIAVLEHIVGQLPRQRMILTGDFNATPWSEEIRALDRGAGLIRRDRALASWPAQLFGRRWPLPFLAIDHVYAGPGWATVRVERGPWLGSDHYPVVVVLAPTAL